MGWVEASLILFGGLVAIMGLGLPVAFSFLALNIVGAWLFLGGEPGLAQLSRNAVQSVTSFSLTPIPFFVLMGEVLFHSGVALKAIDAFALLIRKVPGRLSVIAIVAGTVFSAISGSTIATTALLGSLMLPTMLARGYDPRMAMGPIMGIGAVGAHRAAREPRRHFDRGAAHRRHRAGPDPERALRRLHHRTRGPRSRSGAGRAGGGGAARRRALAAVCDPCGAARDHFRPRDR